MSEPLLLTKLYIPQPHQKIVLRPRLIERLKEGMQCKLTLVSAPAGFGKTTLVSNWIAGCDRPVAWLALDERDKDPARFLTYLVAALQNVKPGIGRNLQAILQSPQPLQIEYILTLLINEISIIEENFLVILDDYHSIDSPQVDRSLDFLIEHQPIRMHLVITTREDPDLHLARLRGRGQCIELRAADLRFTNSETTKFFNRIMRLNLSEQDIDALETRTEGWIAGLQMAAISMQDLQDTESFIQSFSGSHRYVMDYLLEEVFHRQPENIQTFLQKTSILDRMCGTLCDAILQDPPGSGQSILEYLERVNLFIIPQDNERHWYRYHHLFAELLRQRLQQSVTSGNEQGGVAELHIRASQWYEDHALDVEAFHYAAAANDIERAERIIEGKSIPLHFRGAVTTILDWLTSLPKTVLDARPSLWVRYATLSLVTGQTTGVEETLQAAQAALQGAESDDKTRDLIGQIAAARATLALSRYQVETMIAQSRCALEYLHPDNLPSRNQALYTLAFAYHLQGDRAAAGRAYTEVLSISQASGNIFYTILAASGLGEVQELENQLYSAAETYRRVLPLFGDHPQPSAEEAYLGLAHISYEWNDLESAEHHGQQSLQLAQQYDRVIDRFIVSQVFLARLKLARGDVVGAATMLAETEQSARQQNFLLRMPEIAAVQVLVLLRQGNLAMAAQLAQQFELPLSQARVLLAQGEPSAALAVLEPLRQQMEAKGWADELLKVMVLETIALHAHGEKDKAVQLLSDALALAEPGGFIRLFVDEGEVMRLLIEKQSRNRDHPLRDYADKLLAAFTPSDETSESKTNNLRSQIIDPLSQRELEILKLIALGLSNREIGERLFLALDTVKGHNRRIFEKLQVQNRTEAIARARELGLL